MRYVDGYVLPVARKHLGLYLSAARKAGRVWRDHGALEYRECVGEDLKVKWGALFPRVVRAKPGETVVFSWIVFKSRAHRDRVNAKVRLTETTTTYFQGMSGAGRAPRARRHHHRSSGGPAPARRAPRPSMKDERMNAMMDNKDAMPFDMKRMVYGGFKVMVDA